MILWMIVQTYDKNRGSFHSMTKNIVEQGKKRGYLPLILCLNNQDNSQRPTELQNGVVIRFHNPSKKFPIFKNIIEAIARRKQIIRYLRPLEIKENDLVYANGESAWGLGKLGIKYHLRMGDVPVLHHLKNLNIAKHKVSILTRIVRWIHFHIYYLIEKKCVENAESYSVASEETMELFRKYYGCGDKPYFVPKKGGL